MHALFCDPAMFYENFFKFFLLFLRFLLFLLDLDDELLACLASVLDSDHLSFQRENDLFLFGIKLDDIRFLKIRTLRWRFSIRFLHREADRFLLTLWILLWALGDFFPELRWEANLLDFMELLENHLKSVELLTLFIVLLLLYYLKLAPLFDKI